MVCRPVQFYQEQNRLQRFRSLDFMGMMGITGARLHHGWHVMANGAHLAYRKSAFEAVQGYAGNEPAALSDDLFLAQKIAKRWPESVIFLKNKAACVRTEAPANGRAFWQPRLRCGTKNAALAAPLGFAVGILILLDIAGFVSRRTDGANTPTASLFVKKYHWKGRVAR